MDILGIDPGPEKSGVVAYRTTGPALMTSSRGPYLTGHYSNDCLRYSLDGHAWCCVAIEWPVSYGKPVGDSVFHTCRWAGRFEEAAKHHERLLLIPAPQVGHVLCGSRNAKRGQIRRVVLDQFAQTGGGSVPEIGTKAKPGPLYAIRALGTAGGSDHVWSALAVAVAAAKMLEDERQETAT